MPTLTVRFMYGGTTDKNTTNNAVEMSKVFILTLPAFQWIEAPEPADTWRTAHTCEPIGPSSIKQYNQRQMISIGGAMDPNPQGISNTKSIDRWTSGMKILDLTNLTWSDNYDSAAKPYERSKVVNDYYDNNSGYPESWNDPALEAIFKTSRSLKVKPSPTTTGSTASPTGASPSTSTAAVADEKKSTNTGAIAGGVVGGVVALALIGLGVFFWRRRQTQKGDIKYQASAIYSGYGPAEMPVGYKDEPKVEMPLNEYRSELP